MLSDGYFTPCELARRAEVLGHTAIAITDHCGADVVEVIEKIKKECALVNKHWKIRAIAGVELTHVPPQSIPEIAHIARMQGAKVVVVHGETLAEPVAEGTNEFAAGCEDVDILAHPGLITYHVAKLAQDNDVFLEISSRKGHCLTNGHVVKIGKKAGASFLVNSDAHQPEDILSPEKAYRVALGAGLDGDEAYLALYENPKKFL